MKTQTMQHNWKAFIDLFSSRNNSRQTRLGVLTGPPESMEDYWLEDGLPLAGVDADVHGEALPSVEIMLGDMQNAESRRLTHVVSNARNLKIILSAQGDADGLDVEDSDGRITMLRFENSSFRENAS